MKRSEEGWPEQPRMCDLRRSEGSMEGTDKGSRGCNERDIAPVPHGIKGKKKISGGFKTSIQTSNGSLLSLATDLQTI